MQQGKETPLKLRSYSKRNNVVEVQQWFEDMKIVSDVNAKSDSYIEEMEMGPSNPGFVEEASVVERMGTTSVWNMNV